MATIANRKRFLIGLIIVGILGIGLRFMLALYGHNYDFESYLIVADIVRKGQNVYAATSRYNYGPIWSLILQALNSLANIFPSPQEFFRLFVVGLLTLTDALIAILLSLRFGYRAGIIYWINPLTILITGYFSQFDNIAVLLGLLAVTVIESKVISKKKSLVFGLLLLGISITIKHIFFFFPVWLVFKMPTSKEKLLAIIIPYGVFFSSFLPYITGGFNGIIEHVFKYTSLNNLPLLHLITNSPSELLGLWVFFISLLVFGIYLRKVKLIYSLILYLLVLVVFSPSILIYYLVLVIPAIAVFPGLIGALFIIVTGYMACLDGLGLNISMLVQSAPQFLLYQYNGNNVYIVPILIVCMLLILAVFRVRSKEYDMSSLKDYN